MLSLTFVVSSVGATLPAYGQQGITLPRGECLIVVASRQYLHEVNDYLNELDSFEDVRVFKSSNGWYAISVGSVPINASKHVILGLIEDKRIPADSLCSTGQAYVTELVVEETLPERKPIGKSASYRGELTLLTDLDLYGRDLTPNGLRDTNLIDCLLHCKSETKCTALTYDTDRNICYLKTHTDSSNVIGVEGLVSILLPSTQNPENEAAEAYLNALNEMVTLLDHDEPNRAKSDSLRHCSADDYTFSLASYVMGEVSGTRLSIEAEGKSACSWGVPTSRDESSTEVTLEFESAVWCVQKSVEARIAAAEATKQVYGFSGKFESLKYGKIILTDCTLTPY